MTVTCPDCRSVFRVDPGKVPATGVRARCSVCGGIIAVAGGTGAQRTPLRTPVSAGPMVSPGGVSAATGASAAVTPGASPVAWSPNVTPRAADPVLAAPSPAASFAPLPPSPLPSPVGAPARPMSSAPSSSASLTPVMPSTAETTLATATPRRTINPFLNADPGQRARRLARALVSDLVAYHPQKRDEGLAQGTLRQLFREDIKKSYEEYVEQVGRELAESSPHFQDALNDVLAGGQRLF